MATRTIDSRTRHSILDFGEYKLFIGGLYERFNPDNTGRIDELMNHYDSCEVDMKYILSQKYIYNLDVCLTLEKSENHTRIIKMTDKLYEFVLYIFIDFIEVLIKFLHLQLDKTRPYDL